MMEKVVGLHVVNVLHPSLKKVLWECLNLLVIVNFLE